MIKGDTSGFLPTGLEPFQNDGCVKSSPEGPEELSFKFLVTLKTLVQVCLIRAKFSWKVVPQLFPNWFNVTSVKILGLLQGLQWRKITPSPIFFSLNILFHSKLREFHF